MGISADEQIYSQRERLLKRLNQELEQAKLYN